MWHDNHTQSPTAMNSYRIQLVKHFEISIEVEAENAIWAQRAAEDQCPGYTAQGITWLNAPPPEPVVKKPRAPRKPRVAKTPQ
jgi:hypothetical protein